MQDLFFYDFDFNLLCSVRKCISVNYTANYCGYGTFEVHFPLSQSKLLEILDQHNLLLCINGERQAIISGWRVDEDITLFGKTPEWLMTKRAVLPLNYKGIFHSEIAKNIVQSGMGDFVTVNGNAAYGTATDYTTSEVRTVYDAVCDILKKESLGFRLTANIKNKSFDFEVYRGSERPVVLSKSHRSAHSLTYTCEIQDMATDSGWYLRRLEDKGGWNAYTNTPRLLEKDSDNAYTYYKVTAANQSIFGLNCTKGSYIYSDNENGTWKLSDSRPDPVWVYADNPSVSGAGRWDCVISGAKTKEEALIEIHKKTASETADAEVRRLEYGKDYSLGDTVRLQLEWDTFKKTLTKRVVGVHIFYDIDSQGVYPVLSDC